MELFRLMGGLFIIVCGTLIGVYASNNIKTRAELMEQYLIFLNRTHASISYTGTGIKELLKSESTLPLIRPLLRQAHKEMLRGSSIECAWRKATDENIPCGDDRKLIYGFGDNFGTGNIEGELCKLELHIRLVEKRLEDIRSELKTRQRLYRIVGMSGGIMTAVVLI